ncbi:hypothetical protein [Novosphingobium kaempferiae]|uniref:hypothetical protein n=1 Tax=Novosphingobium kaempferiae TaxID=2896849 RepID=UPI001E2A17EE|nr:hypothetical protein [Novosphingobium kaempferiae]
MSEQNPHEHPEVDAVTAEQTAAGMTDEQLTQAWVAVTDVENLTDLEEAVSAEIERRKIAS